MSEIGNIWSVVKRHNQYYEEKLSDLVQEDKIPSYFRDDTYNARINISFGKILATDKGWIPWEKITVRASNLKEYTKHLLEKLNLKKFHDEDAKGGGLLITTDDIGEKAVLFTNPDFPQGYWENHTLPF